MSFSVSEERKKVIEEKFAQNMADYPEKLKEINGFLEEKDEAHSLCLKFLYAFMHVNDIVSYSVERMDSYVKATKEAWERLDYMKIIPEEILLSYVLPARVNNEYLDGSRENMFWEILPLVEGKNLQDAALTVNYWCYSHVTYTPADNRTLGPAAAMRSTLGRCGEESAFTVCALRSVGIPARQCYAPRWSHCDDNHAWVEVWIDGKWHYMGACEPEPVLDKGWFTSAASKAMLTHSRVWNDFLPEREAAYRKSLFTLVNSLERYAKTEHLHVLVTKNGQPAADIPVRFCVLNYSEFYPIYKGITDAKGNVMFQTGLGDIWLQVYWEGRLLEQKVDVRRQTDITLELDEGKCPEELRDGETFFDLVPPKENVLKKDPCPDSQWVLQHESRLEECENIRRAYISTFWQQEDTVFGRYRSQAKGNLEQLDAFLADQRFTPQEKEELLSTLRKKDFVDCTCEMLTDALEAACPYRKRFAKEVYCQYILAPRVTDEMLLPQRAFIRERFPEGFADGEEIRKWLSANMVIKPDHVIEDWYADAAGSLRYGCTSESSFGLLFVTVCRTFGIPARRNPHTLEYEWGEADGEQVVFYSIADKTKEKQTVEVSFINRTGTALTAGSGFSLARFVNGSYETMQFTDVILQGETRLQIPAGDYRLITTVRQIDGTASGWSCFFRAGSRNAGEGNTVDDIACDGMTGDGATQRVTVEVKLPQDQTADRIRRVDVLQGLAEGPVREWLTMTAGQNRILVFAEPGMEPTEHLLQELLECNKAYNEFGCQVMIMIAREQDLDNLTLQKVFQTLTGGKVRCCEDGAALSRLHEVMEVGDERLPFVLALDKNTKGLFATANYNIDTARTLLHVVRLAEQTK